MAKDCFEHFLGRTNPRQFEAELNLVIFTCTLLPGPGLRVIHSQKMVHDPIPHRNLVRRHSAKLKKTEFRVLVPLHKLWLDGNICRLCKQLVFHVEIESVLLSSLLFDTFSEV